MLNEKEKYELTFNEEKMIFISQFTTLLLGYSLKVAGYASTKADIDIKKELSEIKQITIGYLNELTAKYAVPQEETQE